MPTETNAPACPVHLFLAGDCEACQRWFARADIMLLRRRRNKHAPVPKAEVDNWEPLQ
jgi:hypothetical protein